MYFSTKAIDRANRRDAWQSAINNLCGSLVVDFTVGDIDGTIEARKVGTLDGMRVAQPPSTVYRTARHVRGVSPRYVLILQLAGQCRIEQSGRIAAMSPGSVTIIDTTLPSSFRCERKSSYLALHVTKDQLDGRGVVWEAHLSSICPSPTASLMHPLILSTFEQSHSFGPAQAQATSDAIISLFSAGYLDSGENVGGDAIILMPNLLKSVQAYIVTHLHDEDLSPCAIAKAHNISERQLHRLFESLGLSVCRWIRRARLDRCAMDLRDLGQRGRTITEIAFSHGFSDSAHFSRAFREEFNETPRDYRGRVVNGAAPRHGRVLEGGPLTAIWR